ncbi:MAG: hypothetical protein K9N55_19385 [Phycisphaerae bacterium]|nr:hypothetical protein [Phycisphaerae bacterium]
MFALSVIVVSCLAVAVALFLMQCWFEERYGDLAAHWLLPKELIQIGSVLVFVGLSLGLGLRICARLNRDWVMVVGFAVGLSALWGAWWIVLKGRSEAGVVLVDVGRVEPKGQYAVVAFIILSVWAFGLSVSGRDLFMVLNGVLFASSAALSHSISRMDMLFTDRGLYTANGAIFWPDIETYKWTGGTETTHTLLLVLKRRFFKTRVVSIPWAYLDQVSDVLEEYVGQAILHQVEADAGGGPVYKEDDVQAQDKTSSEERMDHEIRDI